MGKRVDVRDGHYQLRRGLEKFMSIWLDMLGARIDYVDLQPYRTRFASGGAGEPVLLVHGTGGHLENFSMIFRSLQENYHVYALDLAGFGLSAKPSITYDIPLWGSQLTRFMERVIGKPCFVVGHSLGGWVAAWSALNHQIWFKKLVLLTGIGFELSQEEGQVLRNFQRSHRESCAKEITREFIRQRLNMLVENKSAIPEEWVEVRYALYTYPETRRVMVKWVDYITDLLDATNKVQPYLLNPQNAGRLGMPMLVLTADKDPFTPMAAINRVLPYCPDVKLHVVKGAGHWPHVEQPQEVSEILNHFFSDVQTVDEGD
jgi:2-hydroxy-6-oxonona-2,4-dienedioate hydrolase